MAPVESQSPKPLTIHGLVVPSEWDDEGRPVTLSIATFSEEEYVIDKNAGGRLLDSIGKEVVIRGVPQEKGKTKSLKNCSILKIKDTSVQSIGEDG